MPGEKTVTIQREQLDTLSLEWQGLLERSAFRTIFSTPQWHQLCWENLSDGNWDLLLLAVRAGDLPLGIAPLRSLGNTICFIGNVEVSDYLDFIVQKGEEEVFYRVLLEALEAEQWTTIDLHCLPEASPTLKHLPGTARSMGFAVTVEEEGVAPAVDLPATWDEFLESLSKKDRHELRRKMRRLATNASARSYALEGREANAGLEDFLRLHRVSSDDKATFMDHQMEGFFRAVVARLAEEGWVRLYFLEISGERVATALCFQHDSEMLLYNSGFDPAYGWLSVGLLLKALCIKDAIASGMKRFDFLRGREHYKYEMGGVDRPIYRCTVSRS